MLWSSLKPTEASKIIDDERGEFWFRKDDTFMLPKAVVKLTLKTPVTNNTVKNKL